MTDKIPLEQKFLQRPQKGALQNREALIESKLSAHTGAPLISAVSKLGRHAAQLVIEFKNNGLDLDYDKAVPVYGLSSKLARKSAAAAIEPPPTTEPKLS